MERELNGGVPLKMSQATMGTSPAGVADLDAATRRRAIISSAVGNFVELYDFLIYGMFAVQIAANFFPKGDPTAALLQAFAIYGVGFFMRPVGAIVIGAYGDRHGRKNALVITVGLMAAATAVTGLIPSYTSIGIAAPILLLLCRLVQGFSTGGEWGGAATFLVEFAPPGKRGLIGSVQQFSVGLALIAGTLTAAVLNGWLSKEAMVEWGWRIPFLIGFVLAPVGLYLRSRVSESPAFSRTVAKKEVARSPVLEALSTHRWPVLAAFGMAGRSKSVAATAASRTSTCRPIASTRRSASSPTTAYVSATIAAVVLTVLTPVMGAISDKIGRKPLLLASSILYGALSWPTSRLPVEHEPDGTKLMSGAVAVGRACSPCTPARFAPFWQSCFRSRFVSTRLSIGYGMSVTLFGGLAPFIADPG